MPTIDHGRALTFGRFADDYDRWRPTYPDDAVDWLVPPAAARVADVGAGTGKLTGRLLDRGLAVVSVEPDPDMLRVLQSRHPDAEAHEALADALPLADASVDAVLVADAWHWFPHDRAVAEVRRVLRPGGWLGLVWNTPTPVEPWEFELAGIDPDRKGLGEGGDVADQGLPFPPDETETATFPWTWEMTPDHWRSFLATNSAVAAMDPEERERHQDAARDLVARVCEESGRPTAPVRHQAFCVRWQPR
jgi:SAM-dependent methyltransferase